MQVNSSLYSSYTFVIINRWDNIMVSEILNDIIVKCNVVHCYFLAVVSPALVVCPLSIQFINTYLGLILCLAVSVLNFQKEKQLNTSRSALGNKYILTFCFHGTKNSIISIKCIIPHELKR